jgi:hypothetical protein
MQVSLDNRFSASRHVKVFKGVKLNDEHAEFIQKIISTPILLDGNVIGVIQISRKGANPRGAGPDFTAEDAGEILALCKPLGELVQHVAGD